MALFMERTSAVVSFQKLCVSNLKFIRIFFSVWRRIRGFKPTPLKLYNSSWPQRYWGRSLVLLTSKKLWNRAQAYRFLRSVFQGTVPKPKGHPQRKKLLNLDIQFTISQYFYTILENKHSNETFLLQTQNKT